MDSYVGKRIDGRYEIREIIGVGGMAVVYKAYDNIDDRIVAVKTVQDLQTSKLSPWSRCRAMGRPVSSAAVLTMLYR